MDDASVTVVRPCPTTWPTSEPAFGSLLLAAIAGVTDSAVVLFVDADDPALASPVMHLTVNGLA